MSKFATLLVILCLIISTIARESNVHTLVYETFEVKKQPTQTVFLEFINKVDFRKMTFNGKPLEDYDGETVGNLVADALQQQAFTTQLSVVNWLQAKKLSFRTFTIQNTIAVHNVDLAMTEQLAKLAGVKMVTPNPPTILKFTGRPCGPPSTPVQSNIQWIGADKFWKKNPLLGRGRGIVLGALDSGVDWKVKQITKQYRGGKNNHDYNWFDPTEENTKEPVDVNGHGTHVTGTMIANEGIGVAPDAQWIHCRGLGPDGTRETVLRCLEFFLNPTKLDGTKPDCRKRPHITSHSYICPFCMLEEPYQNLKSAGIAVVAATGNFGPTCGSIFSPGDYNETFAVGALGQNTDKIAEFSSRGPNNIDGVLSPKVVAPGTNIRSVQPGGTFQEMSGTSMATPHVAGAFALLWSAFPRLRRRVAVTEQIIMQSAKKQRAMGECPGPNGEMADKAPNNVYGWGTIDMMNAYQLASRVRCNSRLIFRDRRFWWVGRWWDR